MNITPGWTRGATIIHADCSTPLEVDGTFLYNASIGRKIACPICGGTIDSWAALVKVLTERSDLWHGAGFAGASSLQLVRTVKRRELFHLDLASENIPPTALLHRVISTAQGPPSPVMAPVLQNLGRPIVGNSLVFWPAELPAMESSDNVDWDEAKVAFFIVWAPQSTVLDHWQLLLTAMFAFYDDDHSRAILDSLNAIDAVSSSVLNPLLSIDGYSAQRVGSVPQRAAIINLIAGSQGRNAMHPRLIPLLSKLNNTRNKGGVAHPGAFTSNSREVATLLAAALAATAYFESFDISE